MRLSAFSVYFVIFLVVEIGTGSASKADRPRGVSLSKYVFYNANEDFTCLDGSRTMPFSHVNDDYCDCVDGSDEPGTSACPNGQFHCTNAGFKPLNIPSSRVNDGLCDCCDGSDEWSNESLCPNNCKELWKAAREGLQKQAEAASRGVMIRKEYSEKGIAKKAENQQKLETLRQDVEEVKKLEEELKLKKEEAEKFENEAKDVEKSVWNNFKEKIRRHQESREAADAFTDLDANKDGSVSVDELIIHIELDPSPDDGEFTIDEAKGILNEESVEAPLFIEVVWKEIASKFVWKTAEEKSEENPDEDEELDEDEDDEDLEEDYPEEEEEEDLPDANDNIDHDQSHDALDQATEEAEQFPEINLPSDPAWSDATKVLIDAAEAARKQFEDNKRKKSDIEREITSLEKELNNDFGPDEAFHELHGNCYELHTHEYTYKLCPFDRAVQKPKQGGTETSLGRWNSWNGPDDNKYSSMKYLNGLKCWNGPDRSTEVKISCGDENKLLSASEPSRCEYRFEFTTPAACETIHVPDQPHDEL